MTHYEKRNFQKIIVSLLGSSLLERKAFFIIAGVLLFFAWLPDGMSSLLDKIFGGEILKWSAKDGTMLVQILGSIVIFGVIKRIIPKDIPNVDICINDRPKRAKVLVLFLSENNGGIEEILKFKTIDEYGRNNYRMPLTAIDYHKDKLEKIIITCSEKSHGDRDKFLKCVQNLFGKEIADMANVRYIKNFEDAKSVYKFLESVYSQLGQEGFTEDDIVFDVTGGQKAISIAGAIFAIPNDRHLQYVSTSDYTVKHYDLTYMQNEE
ncbi:hypothetical protein [uncultured Campylobacter sp.]|uniref:hypothetical protein n=1 Tax=uncultured Campylobacter sp. TaxID=218934 RepID=UPI002629FB67|nr:hypothetical protein [uncultured Campylobacter sp.]